MTLSELRRSKGLTQRQAAELLGIPLRTYSNYETDTTKEKSIKYQYMIEKLSALFALDESNGILTLDEIKNACVPVFAKYSVEYCYLFGSYARGRATPESDVDLLIHTSVSGLRFFGLVEELREALKKKVDVLDQRQLAENLDLVSEILKDGIKIYG